MKHLFIFFFLLFFSCDSEGQELQRVAENNAINTLDFIWKLEKDRIFDYDYSDDHFIRIMIIREGENKSKLEGEVMDKLYFLIGEHGEYPDGRLYHLERIYNISKIDISGGKLILEYGGLNDKKTLDLLIPSD